MMNLRINYIFSHCKVNSFGFLTELFGSINVVIKRQLNETIAGILILKVTIDDTEYQESVFKGRYFGCILKRPLTNFLIFHKIFKLN